MLYIYSHKNLTLKTRRLMGENGEGQITHKFVTRSNKVNHRYLEGSLGCPGKDLGVV